MRAPLEALQYLKLQLGSRRFAAQYQQELVPFDGSFFKRDWLKSDPGFRRKPGDRIIQAWDAASTSQCIGLSPRAPHRPCCQRR